MTVVKVVKEKPEMILQTTSSSSILTQNDYEARNINEPISFTKNEHTFRTLSIHQLLLHCQVASRNSKIKTSKQYVERLKTLISVILKNSRQKNQPLKVSFKKCEID